MTQMNEETASAEPGENENTPAAAETARISQPAPVCSAPREPQPFAAAERVTAERCTSPSAASPAYVSPRQPAETEKPVAAETARISQPAPVCSAPREPQPFAAAERVAAEDRTPPAAAVPAYVSPRQPAPETEPAAASPAQPKAPPRTPPAYERRRAAALCDWLLLGQQQEQSDAYGVPQRLVRRWLREEREGAAENDPRALLTEAQSDALTRLNHLAGQSAAEGVAMIRRRLRQSERENAVYETARRRLDELEGIDALEEPLTEESLALTPPACPRDFSEGAEACPDDPALTAAERKARETERKAAEKAEQEREKQLLALRAERRRRLEGIMERHAPLSDAALTAYLRILLTAESVSAKALGTDEADDTGFTLSLVDA